MGKEEEYLKQNNGVFQQQDGYEIVDISVISSDNSGLYPGTREELYEIQERYIRENQDELINYEQWGMREYWEYLKEVIEFNTYYYPLSLYEKLCQETNPFEVLRVAFHEVGDPDELYDLGLGETTHLSYWTEEFGPTAPPGEYYIMGQGGFLQGIPESNLGYEDYKDYKEIVETELNQNFKHKKGDMLGLGKTPYKYLWIRLDNEDWWIYEAAGAGYGEQAPVGIRLGSSGDVIMEESAYRLFGTMPRDKWVERILPRIYDESIEGEDLPADREKMKKFIFAVSTVYYEYFPKVREKYKELLLRLWIPVLNSIDEAGEWVRMYTPEHLKASGEEFYNQKKDELLDYLGKEYEDKWQLPGGPKDPIENYMMLLYWQLARSSFNYDIYEGFGESSHIFHHNELFPGASDRLAWLDLTPDLGKPTQDFSAMGEWIIIINQLERIRMAQYRRYVIQESNERVKRGLRPYTQFFLPSRKEFYQNFDELPAPNSLLEERYFPPLEELRNPEVVPEVLKDVHPESHSNAESYQTSFRGENISVEVESVNDYPLDERVLEEMLCEIFAEYSNQ